LLAVRKSEMSKFGSSGTGLSRASGGKSSAASIEEIAADKGDRDLKRLFRFFYESVGVALNIITIRPKGNHRLLLSCCDDENS
jgi:hypothetical protein